MALCYKTFHFRATNPFSRNANRGPLHSGRLFSYN